MASSVWGDVGFAAIEVLARLVLVEAGCEGACRSMNLISERSPVSFRLRNQQSENGGELTAACHPARNIIIVKAVDTFEVPFH